MPILVRQLRYGDEELVDLPVDDVADEREPDRPEDVRPYLYRVREDDDDGSTDEVRVFRTLRPCRQACRERRRLASIGHQLVMAQTLPWTIRRCCAVDLDIMATAFEDAMVPSLLAQLNVCFQSVRGYARTVVCDVGDRRSVA
jgi:hypothetical protein